MIKHINHQNFSTTPFVAVKSWDLYNIQNPNTLQTEPALYVSGTYIALEYIDYTSDDPLLNSDCNIALEQQTEDQLAFQEGITGSGVFDPNVEAQNYDGTFKRLVHNQIRTTFYNTYHDPTKIFGIEYIDFPLSKTLRNLSDYFRMFTIPRIMFGDKIVPGSVTFADNNLDDNVSINDDGYQNLVAGHNLFYKVQEVRTYLSPTSSNLILDGSASNDCVDVTTLTITQPQDTSGDVGSTVFFDVTASGVMPFAYRWQSGSTYLVDDARITGSTQNRLTINNLQLTDSGSYRVLVSNPFFGVTSSYAQLHVNLYPPVLTGPVDTSADLGGTFLFNVTASGAIPLWFQWQSGSTLLTNGTRITGSNTASLVINDLTFADTGSYRVFVSNSFGSATSSYANGHINWYPPLIIVPPQDTSSVLGGTFFFNVTASGGLPLYYQWQSGSTYLSDTARITGSATISGSTTASLFINDVVFSDSGSYRVLVSNIYGGVTSSYADGRITDTPPLIVSHPLDQVIYENQTASFSITASGTLPLYYQWISGSTDLTDTSRITGSNTDFLQINNGQLTDAGYYRMFVTNSVGSVYSNTASLTVIDNHITASASDTASIVTILSAGSAVRNPSADEVLAAAATIGLYSGSLVTVVLSTSPPPDSASLDSTFQSGSLQDVVIVASGSNDSASLNSAFQSGSLQDVVIVASGSNDSASIDSVFQSGSLNTVIMLTTYDEAHGITTGLYAGTLATP